MTARSRSVSAPRALPRWARGAAAGALILLAGWLLWSRLAPGFSAAFQGLSGALVGRLTFGAGGHATFLAAGAPRVHDDAHSDSSWDTAVRLGIDGVDETNVITINPRRLAFLPMLFFAAFIAAAPISLRRKLRCLAIGEPILLLAAVGSVWIICAWLFARVPGLVYTFSPGQTAALDFAYEAFVTSIGNKFVVPLAIAVILVLRQLTLERRQLAPAREPRHGRERR